MRRPEWRLEDYGARRLLCKGTTSLVCKAICRRSGMPVTLKVYYKFRLDRNTARTPRQGEKKGRAGADANRADQLRIKLVHPNLATLYAVFEDKGCLVLVQECAAGGPIRGDTLCRMTPAQLRAQVLAPFMNTLAYLHSLGMNARDIKPEDVQFIADGRLLMDACMDLGDSAGGEQAQAGPSTGGRAQPGPKPVAPAQPNPGRVFMPGVKLPPCSLDKEPGVLTSGDSFIGRALAPLGSPTCSPPSPAAAAAAKAIKSNPKPATAAPPPPLSPGSTLLAVCRGTPHAMRREDWRREDYDVTRLLYRGRHSRVYKATCRRSGVPVALKVYLRSRMPSSDLDALVREAKIHTELVHPNIVMLYAAFQDEERLVLVQEYAARGPLRRAMMPTFTEAQVSALVLCPFLDVLAHLHSRGMYARDIKPRNILFTQDWRLLLRIPIDLDPGRPAPEASVGLNPAGPPAPEVSIDPNQERGGTRATTPAPEPAPTPPKMLPEEEPRDNDVKKEDEKKEDDEKEDEKKEDEKKQGDESKDDEKKDQAIKGQGGKGQATKEQTIIKHEGKGQDGKGRQKGSDQQGKDDEGRDQGGQGQEPKPLEIGQPLEVGGKEDKALVTANGDGSLETTAAGCVRTAAGAVARKLLAGARKCAGWFTTCLRGHSSGP